MITYVEITNLSTNVEKLTNCQCRERKSVLFPLSISAKLGRSKAEESDYFHDIYRRKHKICKICRGILKVHFDRHISLLLISAQLSRALTSYT
jgi:hypothetical protein